MNIDGFSFFLSFFREEIKIAKAEKGNELDGLYAVAHNIT